jgi:hypothetical protein
MRRGEEVRLMTDSIRESKASLLSSLGSRGELSVSIVDERGVMICTKDRKGGMPKGEVKVCNDVSHGQGPERV